MAKKNKTANSLPENEDSGSPPSPRVTSLSQSIPLSSYIPVVGVHTTLWAFTALYLPRTSFLYEFTTPDWDPVQLSSKDRPQHPFFEALTLNPTATLASICIGAAVLQSWWADWLRKWWLELGLRGSDAEKSLERAQYENKKLGAFRDAWLATLAGSFIAHLVLVLFGAAITDYTLKTYLLALLLSIMTVYCPAFVVGVPTTATTSTAMFKRWTWVRLFAEFSSRNLVERALVYPTIGTVLGAWIGIIPIALDWDRPWQAWSLTPAFGAIGGYVVSSTVALTINSVKQTFEDQARARFDDTRVKSD